MEGWLGWRQISTAFKCRCKTLGRRGPRNLHLGPRCIVVDRESLNKSSSQWLSVTCKMLFKFQSSCCQILLRVLRHQKRRFNWFKKWFLCVLMDLAKCYQSTMYLCLCRSIFALMTSLQQRSLNLWDWNVLSKSLWPGGWNVEGHYNKGLRDCMLPKGFH